MEILGSSSARWWARREKVRPASEEREDRQLPKRRPADAARLWATWLEKERVIRIAITAALRIQWRYGYSELEGTDLGFTRIPLGLKRAANRGRPRGIGGVEAELLGLRAC